MGDFDFGQFQQIMDYLIDKLNDGDALTPQEQQVYDTLMGFSNQGLNLTNTADFKSLYNAFNGLADEGTRQEFERLYGTGLIQNSDGTISFTRPGSLIEALQRRGQSVNDGPAMAVMSEGLQNYLKQIAQNKFSAMTNSYSAMTPIRGQNIQAATNAGNVASTAIGRRVPVVGGAISGGRRGGGAGEGAGEVGPGGLQVPTNEPHAPEGPSTWERLLPGLLGLAGAGGLAFLTNDRLREMIFGKKENSASEPVAEERAPGPPDHVYDDYAGINPLNPQEAQGYYGQGPGYAESMESINPNYGINMAAFDQQPPAYMGNMRQSDSYDFSQPGTPYSYNYDGGNVYSNQPGNDVGWGQQNYDSWYNSPDTGGWYDQSVGNWDNGSNYDFSGDYGDVWGNYDTGSYDAPATYDDWWF